MMVLHPNNGTEDPPFLGDQISAIHRRLVVSSLLNSSFIIKYDVDLTISVLLSLVKFLQLWR